MSGKTIFMSQKEHNYFLSISLRESEVLKELRCAMDKHDFGDFQISPEQGQFMAFLTRILSVKNYLEIGTFTGYSSLVVAEAMPDQGRVITCDINTEWTDVAQTFWKKAKIDYKIDLRINKAEYTLQNLLEKESKKHFFDMIFIDADKINHDVYYEYSLQLLKTNGIIIIDNIFRHRKVMKSNKDPVTEAVHKLNKKILKDQRVYMAVLPISDGLTIVQKAS